MTKIAIATVNWNGNQDTLEFLDSLKKLDTKGFDVRVFVTDGGSTDGSVEMLKNLVPSPYSLVPILKSENRGSAGGYNDGVKAGLAWGADYFLLINNDTLIKDTNLLKDLIKTMNSDPSIGTVSPKMYFAPGFEYQKGYKKSDEGNILWYAGGSFSLQTVSSKHRGIDEADKGKYDLVEETGFTNAACILVKKEIFEKGIFFDENIFAYFDDNDFLERVKKAGYKLYYDGLTSLYHKVSRTAGIGSPTADYYTSRNKIIFALRYAPVRTKIAVLREALHHLTAGRPMQKKGVIDFFLVKRGSMN